MMSFFQNEPLELPKLRKRWEWASAHSHLHPSIYQRWNTDLVTDIGSMLQKLAFQPLQFGQ